MSAEIPPAPLTPDPTKLAATPGILAARSEAAQPFAPRPGSPGYRTDPSLTAGFSILAITLTLPPHAAQVSISMPNTRFSRCAPRIARCRSASVRGPAAWGFPRPAGVTSARQRLCGANTPWYRVRWTRGRGTSAASRAMKSVKAGDQVLVNGASGGVGTYAVQIGKVLGAKVTGVASTRNLELLFSIGADAVFDYTQQDFTQGSGKYDVIVDNVGSHSLRTYTRVMADNGC